MTNKYSGSCGKCGTYVPARTGQLSRVGGRWQITCVDCVDSDDLAFSRGDDTSYGVVFSSGERFIRNRAGRCEDAPCCGCCTI